MCGSLQEMRAARNSKALCLALAVGVEAGRAETGNAAPAGALLKTLGGGWLLRASLWHAGRSGPDGGRGGRATRPTETDRGDGAWTMTTHYEL